MDELLINKDFESEDSSKNLVSALFGEQKPKCKKKEVKIKGVKNYFKVQKRKTLQSFNQDKKALKKTLKISYEEENEFNNLIKKESKFDRILPKNKKIEQKPSKLSKSCFIPGLMASKLRPYQLEGVKWLYERYSMNTGGILGDDMGLGKTIQIIAFSAAIMGKNDKDKFCALENIFNPNPILIVCPKSLIFQWQDEFQKWGNFKVSVLYGKEASTKQETKKLIKEKIVDVVVTNYQTLNSEFSFLDKMNHWKFVVFDEVHLIKNAKTASAKSCRRLRAESKFGLSGTVIQNQLEELWSIMEVCVPGLFADEKSFKKYFSEPIKRGSRFDSESWERFLQEKRTEELKTISHGAFLRRTKELIRDSLPKKKDYVVFCSLSKAQQTAYRNFCSLPEILLIKNSNEHCDCKSRKKKKNCCGRTVAKPLIAPSIKEHAYKYPCKKCPSCLILPSVGVLRKISNHLCLLNVVNSDPKYNLKKPTNEELNTKILRESENSVRKNDFSNEMMSGKTEVLKSLLTRCQNQNRKVLIFSHSTKMLSIIENVCKRLGYSYSTLDGTMSVKKRHSIISIFNNDPKIFLMLISTKTGGTGLNLTGADVVIIFDIDWNPSYDLQAEDRAYRIGQSKDVTVYRLISSGTIEETIYIRQIDKQLTAGRLYSEGTHKRYFKSKEFDGISNLFNYSRTDNSKQKEYNLTERIVEREQFQHEYEKRKKKRATTDFKEEIRTNEQKGQLGSIPNKQKEEEQFLEEENIVYSNSNLKIVAPRPKNNFSDEQETVNKSEFYDKMDYNERFFELKNRVMALEEKKRTEVRQIRAKTDYIAADLAMVLEEESKYLGRRLYKRGPKAKIKELIEHLINKFLN